MSGWIKVHREIIEKPIWIESTPEQKTILITLLMMANHQEKLWEWKGEKYKVKPGQFITSLDSIVQKAGNGISIKNARTALKRFEKYGFLANESTNKNRLITIVNWGFYQDSEEETASKPASNGQANGKQVATNKNEKNEKNDKEETIIAEIKDLRRSYSSETQDLINQYWQVIKKTRKTNIVSYNIILKTMKQWEKYDSIVIHYALKKHIESYDDGDHNEKYTLGIIRNTSPEQAADLLNRKAPQKYLTGVDKDEPSQYSNIF